MATTLQNKRIVVGVCGGIAAYKAIELCRLLVDAGAHVIPIMTQSAREFIGATTLSALCSEPVQTSLFDEHQAIPHTALGQNADLVVVAPATAKLLSAYASGYSHDLLTNTLLATRAPVLVCPAMHTEMWEHAAVQHNIATLLSRGVRIVDPEAGRLAGGDVGMGRLATPAHIFAAIAEQLAPQDLAGVRVLVTAGGTREAVDPVRFISNRSSGKQGHAIAERARQRGAHVTLITTAPLPVSPGIERVSVESAAQMYDAVYEVIDTADVVIMAAAVADFRPAAASASKIKKDAGLTHIELEPTVDILATLGQRERGEQLLVGFAAETNDLDDNATSKLHRKNLDFIVANDVSAPHVGFEFDTNAVTIYGSEGEFVEVALSTKQAIADSVLDMLVQRRTSLTGQHKELNP